VNRFPTLIWQFLVMKHNMHEVVQAKSVYKGIYIDILKLGRLLLHNADIV